MIIRVCSLMVLLSIILSGCGSAAEGADQATQLPAVARSQPTAKPIAEPTAEPTAKPTSTPFPTRTPVSTIAPATSNKSPFFKPVKEGDNPVIDLLVMSLDSVVPQYAEGYGMTVNQKVAMTTAHSLNELVGYYRRDMPLRGWTEETYETETNNEILLAYVSEDTTTRVLIMIVEGTQVGLTEHLAVMTTMSLPGSEPAADNGISKPIQAGSVEEAILLDPQVTKVEQGTDSNIDMLRLTFKQELAGASDQPALVTQLDAFLTPSDPIYLAVLYQSAMPSAGMQYKSSYEQHGITAMTFENVAERKGLNILIMQSDVFLTEENLVFVAYLDYLE